MSLLQSIILGIIQGLTEFLPISSSAHLVIVPFLLGWAIPEDQNFAFDVLVQMGTLVAVILYFRKDLLEIIAAVLRAIAKRRPFGDPKANLGWYIILATFPAGIFGLLLKSKVEAAFNSPVITALFLFVTAFLLFISEWIGKHSRSLAQMNWKDALWIGCAQAISIFPGVSRSGSTIAGGLSRNYERPAAARFSFLMSIPIMLAAGLLAAFDLADIPNLSAFLPILAAGFLAAAVIGYLSIRWLLSYLIHHSLRSFAFYCIGIAALTLIVAYVR
jgi:undecaprenyl-diphosphatase